VIRKQRWLESRVQENNEEIRNAVEHMSVEASLIPVSKDKAVLGNEKRE